MEKQKLSLLKQYLNNSALIEVDITQGCDETTKVTEILEIHRHLSNNLADYQAEMDRFHQTVRPNLIKLVDAFRQNSLPLLYHIFL